SLEIPEGSVYLLIGPNGSGKSTLLKIITGVVKPSKGNIQVFGLNPWKQRTKLFQKTGAMYEDHPMPGLSTGQDFLVYMAKLQRLKDPKQAALRAAQLFEAEAFWNRPIREYSSGMKRKIALAHAFMGDPELLILDEPTVTLDQNARTKLRDLIQQGLKNKKTFIIAAHVLAESEELATHTAFFADGKAQVQGRIEDLANQYGASRITIQTKDPLQTAKTLTEAGYTKITITEQDLELAVPPGETEKIAKTLQESKTEAKITRTWIDLWAIYKQALKKSRIATLG
ncbi:MAG: ABC transporter ATP-binding protein, partial [Candidatus Bathyarchaeota archaeon]|nr:ABC transporter ATP-binding protein [Candidatus Bathyarchaeota archaeon]